MRSNGTNEKLPLLLLLRVEPEKRVEEKSEAAELIRVALEGAAWSARSDSRSEEAFVADSRFPLAGPLD